MSTVKIGLTSFNVLQSSAYAQDVQDYTSFRERQPNINQLISASDQGKVETVESLDEPAPQKANTVLSPDSQHVDSVIPDVVINQISTQ